MAAKKSSKKGSKKSSKRGSKKGSKKRTHKKSAWNRFVHAHKGKGLTVKKLGSLYRAQK